MSSYAAQKYGMGLAGPAVVPSEGLTLAGASNGAVTTPKVAKFDADSPMVWLLGIGAVTLGLIAASTSVRLGPIQASISAGKLKN